ncbi:hypothetical protein RKD56_005132 [Priestia megaterium]
MRHIVLVLTLLVVGTLGYQMRYRVLKFAVWKFIYP